MHRNPITTAAGAAGIGDVCMWDADDEDVGMALPRDAVGLPGQIQHCGQRTGQSIGQREQHAPGTHGQHEDEPPDTQSRRTPAVLVFEDRYGWLGV